MIAIEPAFDATVRAIGGQRVSDVLGKAPKFENADYLLKEYGVVAELKCLEEDKRNDEKLIARASEIYRRYLAEGRAPIFAFGRTKISTEGFPQEFSREIVELYRKPIQGVIKKANRQIRATKEYFGANYDRGLLLLVNDGHTALDPSHVRWILSNTLVRGNYSSINSVVYATANLRGRHPSVEKELLVWASAHRNDVPACPDKVISDLQRSWYSHLEQAFGIPAEDVIWLSEQEARELKNIT